MDGSLLLNQLGRMDPLARECPDLGEPDGRAWKQLALAFFERGLISVGKAAELARTSRRIFEGWLKEREAVRRMDEADVEADLQWAKE